MFIVTQNCIPLDPSKYSWNENTKIFSTKESYLVLNFNSYDGVTFNTGHNCIFLTGSFCFFNTGYSCFFDTGSSCTFNTGNDCIFKTLANCTFTTGNNCFCIRSDIKGVIEIPEKTSIRLNHYLVPGYKVIGQKPNYDGQEIVILGETYLLTKKV